MDDAGAGAPRSGGASRRRRRVARSPAGPPSGAPASPGAPPHASPVAAAGNAQPVSPASVPRSGTRRREPRPGTGESREAERGLRDLVGAGPSQLGVSRALRARDVNRPTDDDVATADREVVLVRRNWHPA